MPSLAFAATVTITRQTENNFGDHTAGASHVVTGCAVSPTTSTETLGGQDTVIWGLRVLMPKGTDVLATDTVTVGGIEYRVNGQPAVFQSPFTATGFVEVLLTAATG